MNDFFDAYVDYFAERGDLPGVLGAMWRRKYAREVRG